MRDDPWGTRGGKDTPPDNTAPASPGDALVANAIAARTVNEAIRDGRRDESAPAKFICECGALGCHAIIELTPRDYESVRADARCFVIVPGHEGADDEPVANHDRYAIVAKHGAGAVFAQRADPRAVARAPVQYRVPALSFAFTATAEAVTRARHWVGEFVEAHTQGAELRARILLAFTEAFSNAVVHAYDAGRPGKVEV